MIRQVERTISKYNMFRPGDRVAVAVSGGADSTALLHTLHALAHQLGIRLAVAHFNHQLRAGDSDEDERFVRELAQRLDLPFLRERLDVRNEAEKRGENLEQVARECRYQWFARLIQQGLADKIALGHTKSDQAETVLHRILRGAGTAGLAAIRPMLPGGIVRPLIDVSGEDVRSYCQRESLDWRQDSSNNSLDFVRNRIRHQLMPQLVREWNPNLPSLLAHMAEWAGAEEDYWQPQVAALVAQHLRERLDGVYLDASAVRKLPVAAQRRLLRAAIARARGSLRAIDFEHIEAVRALTESRRGSGQAHLPGLQVMRSFDQVRFAATCSDTPSVSDYTLDISGPGSYPLPGSSNVLILTLSGGNSKKQRYNDSWRQGLDWEKIPKLLKLRSWRPGDCYQPRGCSRARKLKSLFHERQVAVWERLGWPVISAPSPAVGPRLSSGAILWARGFGPSIEFAATEQSGSVLEIHEVTGVENRNPGA